jgi:hypothetical protein
MTNSGSDMTGHKLTLAFLTGAVLVALGCAPGASSPLGTPSSFAPTTCYSKSTTDMLCARQADVGYGTGTTNLTQVTPGGGPVNLLGIRYVEAKGKGSLDLSLQGDAICTANAIDAQQPTGLITRYPDGTLMTLLMGRAVCTITGGRSVVIGGRATLKPDGTVDVRDPIAEISSDPGIRAQFIIELPERLDLVSVHASSNFKFARRGNAQTAVAKFELVTFLRTGTGFDKTTRGISAFDASVLERQAGAIQ